MGPVMCKYDVIHKTAGKLRNLSQSLRLKTAAAVNAAGCRRRTVCLTPINYTELNLQRTFSTHKPFASSQTDRESASIIIAPLQNFFLVPLDCLVSSRRRQ